MESISVKEGLLSHTNGRKNDMTKYDVDLDMLSKNSLSIIANMVRKNSKVLEFGPANGRLTRYLKAEKNCSVDIVEIDEESGKEAAQYANIALIGDGEGDIEKYEWRNILKKERYDYIIFADVLEHLYYPEKVLKNAITFLKDDGSVLISIPNVAHNSIIIDLINDEFKYTEVGLLDNTHIRFFTYNSLKEMIRRCDLVTTIEDATYEGLNDHFAKPLYSDTHNFYIEDILRNRDKGNVYQFVFKLQKKEFYYTKNPLVSINIDGKAYNEVVLYFKTIDQPHYSEMFTKRIKIDSGNVQLEVDFPKDIEIKSVRFDPFAYKCLVKLKNIAIRELGETYKAINKFSSNAKKVIGDYYLFDSSDPQIEFMLEEKKLDKLFIDYEIYKLYDESFIELFFTHLQQQEEEKKLNQELTQKLQAENKEKEELTQKLQAELKEVSTTLNDIYSSRGWKCLSKIKQGFGK